MTAPLSRERIEEIVALHSNCMSGEHVRQLASELLEARAMVGALREWIDISDGKRPDLTAKAMSDNYETYAEYVAHLDALRARIGRTDAGEWSDEGK